MKKAFTRTEIAFAMVIGGLLSLTAYWGYNTIQSERAINAAFTKKLQKRQEDCLDLKAKIGDQLISMKGHAANQHASDELKDAIAEVVVALEEQDKRLICSGEQLAAERHEQ